MKISVSLVLTFALVCCGYNAAICQWTQVPIPAIYYQVVPYYLNENVGFIYDVGQLSTQPNLRRTTDNGISWKALRFFDGMNVAIKQLYFVSLDHGYAATSDGVYETQDMGDSWKRIYTMHLFFNSVYAFGNKVFAFACDPLFKGGGWGPLLQSSDDGKSWDTVIKPTNYTAVVENRMKPYVFGNKDSLVYAENIDPSDNMFLVYSTNNGRDWLTNTMDIPNKTFTMGFFPYPHCNDLLRTFISPHDNGDTDLYFITHSSDLGQHWDTVHTPIEIGAWIAGSACIQYVSNASFFRGPGIYRSTDRAKNWKLMQNPDFNELDDVDFHNLSVVGGGAVVYAADVATPQNNLWKTTSGGDGTISFAPPGSQISMMHDLSSGNPDTLSISVCGSGMARMFFQNSPCSVYANLDSIAIDGLDTSEYKTQLQHHVLCDGVFDTLLITIKPSKSGNRNLVVHAHFINDEYYGIDTSFAFALVTIPGLNTNIYLRPSSMSTAASDTAEIPLYVNNPSPSPVLLSLDSLDLTYDLNSDLITPAEFAPSFNGIGITASIIKTTPTSVSFTLYFPPGFTFTGETVLGKLRCAVYVADTSESDITVSGNTHSNGCQSILSNSVVHFSLAPNCGDSMLSNFLKYRLAYSISSIIPNPARNTVNVKLNNNNLQIHYDLFDALGVERKEGVTTGNAFQIDLSELSSGRYYLRVSSENGIPITKRLVIAK